MIPRGCARRPELRHQAWHTGSWLAWDPHGLPSSSGLVGSALGRTQSTAWSFWGQPALGWGDCPLTPCHGPGEAGSVCDLGWPGKCCFCDFHFHFPAACALGTSFASTAPHTPLGREAPRAAAGGGGARSAGPSLGGSLRVHSPSCPSGPEVGLSKADCSRPGPHN